MSQISNSNIKEFIHFFSKDLSPVRFCPVIIDGASPPHPKTRAKSFPVPNGTIPIGQLSISI